MRPLLTPPGASADDLDGWYAYPADPSSGRWLRANMVATLDGAITDSDGRSDGISGATDKAVFRVLRRLADCVVVGAGTLRAEGYGPAACPIVVVTRSLDLDLATPLFTAATHRTIVVTCADAPAERRESVAQVADVVVAGTDTVDLARAIDELVARGHRRLLTEGGPRLLADIVGAGLLDELCLTTSPLLVGGEAGRALHGAGIVPPTPMHLHALLEEDDVLLATYRR